MSLAIVLLACLAAAAACGWWMIGMPGRSWTGPLDPLDAQGRLLTGRLKTHVTTIASTEHNMPADEAYEAAARYLEEQLAQAGHLVRRQEFSVGGGRVRNLDVEIRGSDPRSGVIVVGAHYDSVHGAPGANDNGSGTAAVVELARLLAGWKPIRTWRLALFANEEPPYFKTESMGSAVYARAAKSRGEQVAAMFSLETMGYYSDAPGSQHYPVPFNLAYPDRGDFIAFVGNVGSRNLVREAVGLFRQKARFPSEGIAAPQSIPGVDWSDHWAFWREGWPALMVTDTAPFRYPHYHTAADTPDKVDYERLARVVLGLEATFRALDGAVEP